MEDYATREDADELRGKHGNQPRFKAVDIDPEKGSATATSLSTFRKISTDTRSMAKPMTKAAGH
jgi:hypothetical protein